MKDRIPTKPGRIQLVPSADDEDLFILTRADEPTQTGTPLNKGNLLSDATAAMMNLTGEPTVNDALAYLADRVDSIKTGEGAPTPDITAHLGDIYIQDAGGARRTVYICDALGEKPADIRIYWSRGSLSNGVNAAANYRVRSDLVLFPKGTKLSIASGFRFALYLFYPTKEYNQTIQFRTSDYTFGTDQLARVLIARTSENTSETADINTFAGKLEITANGSHWTRVGAAKTVQKTVMITESCYWTVPDDLIGNVTVMAFGGGAGGSAVAGGYGGGGGNRSVGTFSLTEKRYQITIGAGGTVGGDGGTTTFGSLLTAYGGSGINGGSGGGGGNESGYGPGGNGSYGGGGGGYGASGGDGGTYGGGGGGGHILSSGSYHVGSGGSGKSGAFVGGAGNSSSPGHGGGGGGYAANGSAATTSASGTGGAGLNTNGFSLDFEGVGNGGSSGGGGGGYGGNGGSGSTNPSGSGGGGGGYGTGSGGSGGTAGGGGGGGWGGKGGNGGAVSPGVSGGGGGGGYGLSGNGGAPGVAGGLAAGGGCGAPGGPGVVIITYTGVEAV